MDKPKRFAVRSGTGRWWSGRGSGRAAAGIYDDSRFAPGGEEGEAGGVLVVLEDEVVQVLELVHEVGDFGIEFFEQGAATDDAGAGRGIHGGKGAERGLELGDERRGRQLLARRRRNRPDRWLPPWCARMSLPYPYFNHPPFVLFP